MGSAAPEGEASDPAASRTRLGRVDAVGPTAGQAAEEVEMIKYDPDNAQATTTAEWEVRRYFPFEGGHSVVEDRLRNGMREYRVRLEISASSLSAAEDLWERAIRMARKR
jgi:hypothetical protein